MFRRLLVVALAVASFGMLAAAQAQRADEKWVRLGARELDLSKENATIDVSGVKGAFKALRVESRRGAVVFTNIDVKYTAGRSHEEKRRITMNEGDRTRPINAGNDDRFIDVVTVSYEPNRGASRSALVEVWGLQSAAGERLARTGGVPAASSSSSTANPGGGAVTGPLAGAATSGASTARAGTLVGEGEVLFGAQRVGFGVDRDVIQVGAEVGLFDRIRLRVLENDIQIKDMTVVYANGEKDTLAVNAAVKRDSRTQWFQLKGDRFIKEIQFTYASRPNFRGLARIEVSGEYAEGWLGPQGKGKNYNSGWVLLGAQTAGFLGFDNDLVPVGKNEGGFRKLRVNVRDRAITLDQIRVIYATGSELVIPVNRQKIEAGGTYGPVDLKDGARGVKEIRMRYRSRFIDRNAAGKGAAIVEVWGQH